MSSRSPVAPALRVLVIGGVETRFHQFEAVGPVVTRLVEASGHHATALLAPDALKPEVLRGFDAIVSVTTGGELSGKQEEALLGAVAEGRNDRSAPLDFLGIHGASCSFEQSGGYLSMLGGRFLRHPPMTTFRVAIAPPEHPITNGIADFDLHDELYILELLADVQVLLRTGNPEFGAGTATVPLGWVRRHGHGKVCYLAPGHGSEQLEHPSVQRLIAQTLSWFAHAER